MEQRRVGLLLLTSVLLTAAVVPRLFVKPVAGHAVAHAVEPPPPVGACVISIGDPWLGFTTGVPDDQVIDYPTAVFGVCGGAIIGEVSTTQPGAFPPTEMALSRFTVEGDNCAVRAVGYTGSIAPVVSGLRGERNVVWQPSIAMGATPVGPTPEQRAAGQHWSACVIGDRAHQPYQGKLQNSLSTGALPNAFASCWSSTEFQESDHVPCAAPHLLESFGTTVMTGSPDGPTMQHACQTFAGRALRTADPTRGGQLHIRAVAPTGSDGTHPSWGLITPSTYWVCMATEAHGRSFDGTLVGLGNRPLPLV